MQFHNTMQHATEWPYTQQGPVPGRHFCHHGCWALTQDPNTRNWKSGGKRTPDFSSQSEGRNVWSHASITCLLGIKTWKVCTIPVNDLLTVKKCILTTEHTCSGMFLPEAWRRCKAHGQLTCQEHVDCETLFLVFIEFISQLFHFISLMYV